MKYYSHPTPRELSCKWVACFVTSQSLNHFHQLPWMWHYKGDLRNPSLLDISLATYGRSKNYTSISVVAFSLHQVPGSHCVFFLKTPQSLKNAYYSPQRNDPRLWTIEFHSFTAFPVHEVIQFIPSFSSSSSSNQQPPWAKGPCKSFTDDFDRSSEIFHTGLLPYLSCCKYCLIHCHAGYFKWSYVL